MMETRVVYKKILPIPGKGGSDWQYAWIPVVGPLLGGILGSGMYFLIGF